MFQKLIKVILLISVCVHPCYGATISGTIASLPDSYVTLTRYSDLALFNKAAGIDIYTDSLGRFAYKLDVTGTELLKITNEKGEEVSFYCTDRSNCIITEQKGQLIIGSNTPDINTVLKSAINDLALWRKTFVTDKGVSIAVKHPAAVLEKINSLKNKYRTNDSEVNTALSYYFAGQALAFITTAYVRADEAGAKKAFDTIQQDYLINKQVKTNDPFYMQLLEADVSALIHNANFERSKATGFGARIKDLRYFKNDTLREMAEVLAVKHYYTGKWYKNEGMAIEQFDDSVLYVRSAATLAATRRLMQLLVVANNQIGPGIKFPILSLPAEEHRPFDLTQVHSPYTLVNFWSTRCGACTDELQDFAALQEQYMDKLTIICISVDKDEDRMREFLATNKYDTKWLNVFNGDHGNYIDRLHLGILPATYLLDAGKRIIAMPDTQDLIKVLQNNIR